MKSIGERLIKGSGIYVIGKMLPEAIKFLLIPIYTRFLTTSDYGIVAVVGVVGSILNIILLMGLPESVTRFYFDYSKKTKEFKDFLGSISIFYLLFSLLVVIILTFFGESIFGNLFSKISFSPYIKLALWTSFFVSLKLILLNVYRAEERSLKYVAWRLASFLFTTGLIIYFVVIAKEGALGKIKGAFYASFTFFIIFIIMTFKEANITISKTKLFSALKFGVPLVPHVLSVNILASADRILLERLSTLSEVGLYNVGYQIGQVFFMIMSSINYAWVPIYYAIAQDKAVNKAKKIFSRMTTLYIALGSFFASGVILFSREIIYFFTTERFYSSYHVVPIIAISYVLHLIYIMDVRSLYLEKKTYMIPSFTIIAVIVNIGLNILWIPEFGMVGAAYATLIAHLIQSSITHIFAQRVYQVKYDYRNIFIILSLVGGVFFINNLINFEEILTTLVVKISVLISFLGLLFLLRIISVKEIRRIKDVFRT
jgi:O-antigen/teichoic acid export membrane protein